MPVWVLLYFTAYATVSVWAHSAVLTNKSRDDWKAFELIGNLCLMVPALAFWYAKFASFPPEVLAFAYGFGLMALFVSVRKSVKQPYTALKARLYREFGKSALSTLALLSLISPLLWWGAAKLAEQNLL